MNDPCDDQALWGGGHTCAALAEPPDPSGWNIPGTDTYVGLRAPSWSVLWDGGLTGSGWIVLLGIAVVVGIFFLPFVFDDFVAKSKVAAFVVVLGIWLAMRIVARR